MKRLLQHCLEQIINDRFARQDPSLIPDLPEECWCYDEQDGALDAKPGMCLACRLREAIECQDVLLSVCKTALPRFIELRRYRETHAGTAHAQDFKEAENAILFAITRAEKGV